MKKPETPTALAAYLIQIGIDQMTRNPAMRRRTGITLADLAEAARVRRRLLKETNRQI
ncbi:hypothetical protein A6C57_25700 [Fibrella sp. ES10-3-2-2]